MKCKECSNEVVDYMPYEKVLFNIRGFEIRFINWNKKDYALYCGDCLIGMQKAERDEYERGIYENGWNDAMDKNL